LTTTTTTIPDPCANPTTPNGTACDDNNACTTGDTCQNGTCTGSAVACDTPGPCHNPGACDPATGQCAYPSKMDGTPCSDGNACTVGDTCQGGSSRRPPRHLPPDPVPAAVRHGHARLQSE